MRILVVEDDAMLLDGLKVGLGLDPVFGDGVISISRLTPFIGEFL